MRICEYGCGREAKFPPRKGMRKWSCSKNPNSCPAKRKENSIQKEKEWKDPNSGLNSDLRRDKQSDKMKELREDPDSEYNSDLYKEKMSISTKLTIEQIKERHPFFSDIEEMRYNPDKPEEKEIQVHCTNHNCPNSKEKGGWFTPTRNQFKNRKDWLSNEGEDICCFYCSQECKDTCPSYRLRYDPFHNTEKPYTQEEYDVFNKEVLERQRIRDKYNFCEICYLTENLHVHHEKPVKTHPLLALDPDNGIVLCQKCHYKYGHKTGTECSTGALANKVLPDCKLGGQK